jgi:hypothetical protein
MLIEFKIQVEDSGGATVVPTTANTISSTSPVTGELGPATDATTPSTTTANPTATNPTATKGGKGGSAPIDGPGTGPPTGVASGPVFVIGPIVIFGSNPGQNPGGSAPIDGPGTGKPGHDKTTTTKTTSA